MVEMAPGAGATRHLGPRLFGQLGGHAAGFDGAPRGRLARPGFFHRFTKPQNSHCHSSHENVVGGTVGQQG